MFKPVRVVATVVLVISIAFGFISAFVIGNALLCLIMVIVEYLAYLWYVGCMFQSGSRAYKSSDQPPCVSPCRYCLSYIPYARDVVWNLLPEGLKWK
jgi:hypothetical protein